MPEGYAYHRLAGGNWKVIYPCRECGSRGQEFVDKTKENKYTRAGLCRACFEIRVAAVLDEEDKAGFDAILQAIPNHEDFCSGKIKVLTYILYENGGQNYCWSSEEKDAEITEAMLDDVEKKDGIKVERLAVFKVYKVFDRTEGKANGPGNTEAKE